MKSFARRRKIRNKTRWKMEICSGNWKLNALDFIFCVHQTGLLSPIIHNAAGRLEYSSAATCVYQRHFHISFCNANAGLWTVEQVSVHFIFTIHFSLDPWTSSCETASDVDLMLLAAFVLFGFDLRGMICGDLIDLHSAIDFMKKKVAVKLKTGLLSDGLQIDKPQGVTSSYRWFVVRLRFICN